MKDSLSALFVCLLPFAAQAQEPSGALQLPASPAEEEAQPPSPALAFGLSLGSTLASYGTGLLAGEISFRAKGCEGPCRVLSDGMVFTSLAGLVVAPSIGHFYKGETRHALITTGLRGLAMTAVVVGANQCVFSSCDKGEQLLLDGGAIALLALGVYDLVDLGIGMRAKKETVAAKEQGARFSLLPAPVTSPDGLTTLGLSASGSF